MSKKERKSSFAGKVRSNAEKSKRAGATYGYLNLPKGVPVFNPVPGSKAFLDFLPYRVTDERHPDRDDDLGIALPDELWYKRPFKVHRNIGSANDTVVCLTSIGKKCPICEYRATQIKDRASKEITDALKPSFRNLYVVVPKHDKKYEEKPHIFDISQFLFQNLLTEELEERENCEIFPDLEEGLTLRIRFDSSVIGDSKPFAEASRIDFEERKEQYGEDILDEIPNLDEVLIILSAAELEKKFFEMEDEDTDDDNPPTSREKKTSFSAKDKAKKKEDDVKDPADDDDDDPPAKPTKKPDKPAEKDKVGKCVACGGSGKDSKGKTCRICRGTGKKKDEGTSSKCPHGHKFGIDAEEFDECYDCSLWDECMDEKEKGEA